MIPSDCAATLNISDVNFIYKSNMKETTTDFSVFKRSQRKSVK